MVQALGIVTLIGVVSAGLISLVRLFPVKPKKASFFSALIVLFIFFVFVNGGVSLGEFFGGDQMERVLQMLGTVFISVSVCIGIWVVANVFVSQAARKWAIFSGLVGAVAGGALFGLLRGNRSVGPLIADVDPIFAGQDPLVLLDAVGTGVVGHLEWPLVGAVLFGGSALVSATLANRVMRLAVVSAAAGVAGWLVATNTRILQRPSPDWVAIVIATLVLAGIGAALGYRSGRVERGALIGAGIGWAVGAWLLSPFLVVVDVPYLPTIVPLVLIMMGFAWQGTPTDRERARFEDRARAVAFLGPALLFLFGALVVPALRTAVLSFQDRAGTDFVGFDNYQELFTAETSADVSNWPNIFTSNLFFAAVILLLVGLLVGLVSGIRRNGSTSFESGPTSTGAILVAAFVFSFAVLSVLRGTFFNNLWWVITVVTVATVAGLAVAVLADRAVWGQNIAKSLIFMPMAISLVGASIVWRLQFQARPADRTQTGALNAVWVLLGRLTNSGLPRVIVLVVLAAITGLMVLKIVQRLKSDRPFTGYSIGLVTFGWLTYRLAGPGLGGFRTNAQGEVVPETIQFLTEQPFNNVWLMVILIWMQTGFAMVIFSAAIKAVPQEFIEAAEVDGATGAQVFFNVTLPTILPTVGVVVTTMIVQVTKVFDIVAVAGLNGIFGNNVLANQMFTESFLNLNRGFGAAIAIVMFLLVLPVMVYNIYNMQKAAL